MGGSPWCGPTRTTDPQYRPRSTDPALPSGDGEGDRTHDVRMAVDRQSPSPQVARPTVSVVDALALIRHRLETRSEPGHRDDGARLALVVEGGSARAAYGAGMVAALEELGVLGCLDAAYGSSAGALNVAWLLSGRACAMLPAWWDPAVMTSVINLRRALWGRPVVDTDVLVERVYEYLVPMDFDAVLASPVTFHPLATDTQTGAAVDLHPLLTSRDRLKAALRATTRMPVLSGPPVEIAGRRYVDAGLAEHVPVHTALAQGATHLLVLRTLRSDEHPCPPKPLEHRVVASYLGRHAPGAVTAWLSTHERSVATERALATHPGVLQVRPPLGAPRISRTGRDTALLSRAVGLGRAAVLDALRAPLPALV